MQRNTLKSFQWSFFTALLRKVILFGVFLLVAKAISKEDLGIFREFSLVLGMITAISYFGFKDLLIVKKENTQKLFHQLFLLSLLVSFTSLILLNILAPIIGKYYKSDILSDLLIKLSPLICLEILRIAVRAYYQKILRFKLLALIETINVVVYSALIGVFFFFQLNITTLIMIFYLGNLIEFILLLSFESQLIKESFRRVFTQKLFKDFLITYKQNFKFLVTATSNNVVSMLINDLPVIILGILFNPVFIGIYYLANQLIGQPVILACNSLAQVLFPTFTFMDKTEIYDRLKKFFNVVTLFAYPLFFLFVIYVLNLVPLILGDKWNESLPIVVILAFPLATTMLINPISSLPYVLEKPHIEIIYMIINLSIKSIAIYLGHFSGFETALLYYAIATVIIHLGFITLVSRLVNGNPVKTLVSVILKSIPTLTFIGIYLLTDNQNILLRLAFITGLIGIYLLFGKLFKFINIRG